MCSQSDKLLAAKHMQPKVYYEERLRWLYGEGGSSTERNFEHIADILWVLDNYPHNVVPECGWTLPYSAHTWDGSRHKRQLDNNDV